MSERKCTVVRESVTTEDIRKIRENQQNMRKNVDVKNDNGTALSKALKGSEEYLKAQGYVKIELGDKDV